ncbi:MAG: hypothetical protein IJ878_14090, partial [Exiguobacterium sp.]|nr:hypothetical protein [Exiguobacterium sp.]
MFHLDSSISKMARASSTIACRLFTSSGELLATYLLRNLKWELLGKTVLLPATVIYQARLVVPTLKEFVLVCQHQQVDARVDVTV